MQYGVCEAADARDVGRFEFRPMRVERVVDTPR